MDKTEFEYSDTWKLLLTALGRQRLALMDDLRRARSWDDVNKINGMIDGLDWVQNLPNVLFTREGEKPLSPDNPSAPRRHEFKPV